MEEYKPQQEKEVTFENTIFVGNKINLEGERYEITSMKHEGKARPDGGYYVIDLKNLAPGKEDMITRINIGLQEAPDSYILYQNGKK